MKNLLRQIAAWLLLLGCLSCIDRERPKRIDIPKAISLDLKNLYTDSMNLSDIASKIEYIPLQATDSSLLNYFYDFAVTKDFFFIKNELSIVKYDISGKFIKSLFKVGRGPAETGARSFAVDESGELVYVLDAYIGNIKVFDYKGTFVKTIKEPINSAEHQTTSIGFFCDKLFISTAQRPFTKYIYSFFDLVKDSILIVHKNYNNYTKSHEMQKRFFTLSYDYNYQITDSSILFKENYSDTIFKLNKDLSKVPKYILDLNNRKLKWEDFRDNAMFNLASTFPNGYWVQSFAESSSMLLLILRSYHNPEIFIVYDKNKDSFKAFRNLNYKRPSDQIFLRNDLDKIAAFPPMNKNGNLNYCKGCLYSIIEASDFVMAYNKASIKTKSATKYLRDIAPTLNKINAFSNPVIMKIYLK
jgi:hypothetical protein